MDADLDTLATALYVTTDDLLKESPQLAPYRPEVGIDPKLSDAELVTLAGHAGLTGVHLRGPVAEARPGSPTAPVPPPATAARLQQAAARCPIADPALHPGLGLIIRAYEPTATDGWWIPPRSSAAAPARPPNVLTWPDGPNTGTAPVTRATSGAFGCTWCAPWVLPVAWARAKADEREVLAGMFTADPELVATRPGQTLIGARLLRRPGLEATMAGVWIKLLRPARKGEPEWAGAQFFKPLRQIIESINNTFKGELDLEQHGGHTPEGVCSSVLLQRILALTAAIWHNDLMGEPVKLVRSSFMTTDPLESII